MEEGVHLEGPIEVVLTVEDGHADVLAPAQQLLEFVRRLDRYRLVASLGELCAHSDKLSLRKSDGYGWPRQLTRSPCGSSRVREV